MVAPRRRDRSFTGDVESVLAASRVLVGVAAQSLADIEDIVSVPQLRALMILATHGPLHLTALAEHMGVHPSNATRACDRLVAAGLLDRRDNPADRRHLLLELTPAGQRHQLGESLGQFAAAGGEPSSQDLLALGWIS